MLHQNPNGLFNLPPESVSCGMCFSVSSSLMKTFIIIEIVIFNSICINANIKNININKNESENEIYSVMPNSLWPHGLYSPWNSLGQNTGVGNFSLFQGIFPIQELNWGLLHCREILYQPSYQGSPILIRITTIHKTQDDAIFKVHFNSNT